jgi:hypothetical protein
MNHSALDWVAVMGIFLSLVGFFVLVQHRTVQGQFVSLSFPSCVSLSNSGEKVVVSKNLVLCPNTIHSIDYFLIQASNAVIDCQHSSIQGSGGSLFVSSFPNPSVTLKNCEINGFDGLYPNNNPVTVYVE